MDRVSSVLSRLTRKRALYVRVEVLQQHLAGLGHAGLNLFVKFSLKPVERRFDFLGVSASLIDLGDAPFNVHAGLKRAQHLVACPKDAVKQLKLLAQKFENTLVGLVRGGSES